VAIATQLRRAHLGGIAIGHIAASELGLRLVEHLLFHYSEVRVALDRVSGMLDRRRLLRVADFIEAGLSEPLDIPVLAAVAGLSPFHFSRAFRKATGMSPHAYVAARRLSRARLLALGSNLTVDAIAASVGYSNISHFRRIFKAEFGATPAAIRASPDPALLSAA
jgi:AraC family transcriptional regulator